MRIRPIVTAATLAVALATGLLVAAARPAPAAASTPCWVRVQNDWLNHGVITGHYSVHCLQQALKNLNEDLRDYSNIGDAINAAIQTQLRGTKGGGPNDPNSSGGATGGGKQPDSAAGKNRELQVAPPDSYYRRAINSLGTTSANSLPIPLLVLAGLGTALLLSAAGLAAHRRLKARSRPPAR
jgi:hypothetical protein